MKWLSVALVFGMLFSSCQQFLRPEGGGPKKTTRELQGLNGPVRSVFVAVAVPVNKSGAWEPGEQKPVSVETYDKRGNRTEHVHYTAEGTISNTIVFTYDTQGNETEAIRYDTNGVTESRTVSTYDAEGRRTESRSYTTNDTLTHRTVFSYGTQGHETAAHNYAPEGALVSSTTSTYDIEGNLAETSWYYADSKPGSRVVYRRDAKGLLLSSISFDYAPDGTLQSRTDATYDGRGNPTEAIWYSEGGRFKRRETSTYRYDVFGNWIQRTTTHWVTVGNASFFEPPRVTYRTVTYYDKGME